VLEIPYFQWHILNANKIDVVIYSCEVICRSLLICFIVFVRKISYRIDKPFWNYSNFYCGIVVFHTQCIWANSVNYTVSGTGRSMSTGQRAVKLCQWEINALYGSFVDPDILDARMLGSTVDSTCR